MYTVEDVAKLTGLTTRTIRNYLKDGKLKGKKVGSKWRFSEANVSALITDFGGALEDEEFEKAKVKDVQKEAEATLTEETAIAKESSVLDGMTFEEESLKGFFANKHDVENCCVIIDFPLVDAKTTRRLLLKFMSSTNGYSEEDKPVYTYEVKEAEQFVRFFLTGKPGVVGEVLTYLK